jgi:hypothetical protein
MAIQAVPGKTCCLLSSLKTLLIPTKATVPPIGINVPSLILVGRFSGDPHWPVLGDRRGMRHWPNVIVLRPTQYFRNENVMSIAVTPEDILYSFYYVPHR